MNSDINIILSFSYNKHVYDRDILNITRTKTSSAVYYC